MFKIIVINSILILRIFGTDEQQLIPVSSSSTAVSAETIRKIEIKPYFTKWRTHTQQTLNVKRLYKKNNNLCVKSYFEKWHDYKKFKVKYLKCPLSFQYCSSETSPGTIGSNIINYVSSCFPKNIIIASDQFTNETFLDQVLGLPGIVLTIITSDSHPKTNTTLKKTKYTGKMEHHSIAGNANKSGKMHNKFIVINDTAVITGSPNCTHQAYNSNIESFVVIINQYVAYLYQAYAHYICSGKDKDDGSQPEYQHVAKMLSFFNMSQTTLQVCLAPIVNIGHFVPQFFPQASILRISMFLLSNNSAPPDIMKELMKTVEDGAKVSIKVDKGQHAQDFVQKALKPFIERKQSVETVSKHPEKTGGLNPLLHDKLILIEKRDGTKFVIIGSAGFSTNVQQNLNLENMVIIMGEDAHNFFSAHFNALVQSPTMTVEKK